MLTIENYYYSDEQKKPVTDVHELQDDDTVEIEINIRYPVRFKVAHLKEQLKDMGYEPGLGEDAYDEMVVFHLMFQNLLKQTIDECTDEIDPETAKKMYDTLKDSEVIGILSDICKPMKIKVLSEHDQNKCTCCGPFPNPNFWSDAEKNSKKEL